MRTIKFRGKRIDNGKLVEGDLIHGVNHKKGKMFILPIRDGIMALGHGLDPLDGYEVRPDSVGLFTGQQAPNRKKHLQPDVFPGDVFRQEKEDDKTEYLVVMWIEQRSAFYLIPTAHYHVLSDNDCSNEPEFAWLFSDAALYDFSIDCGLTMVGNIYDNPELLEL